MHLLEKGKFDIDPYLKILLDCQIAEIFPNFHIFQSQNTKK